MNISYPFSLSLILFIFWMIYKFFEKKDFSYIVERFLISSSMVFAFFLSPIINVLADFFNCTLLYDNYYMTNNLVERCNDTRYNFWQNFLIIPSFVFFAIFFPLSLFFYMYKNRSHLFESQTICKIGFLLNGYYPTTYYW